MTEKMDFKRLKSFIELYKSMEDVDVVEKDWSQEWLKINEKNFLASGKDQILTNPAEKSYLIQKCVKIISQNFPQAPFVIFNMSTKKEVDFDSQLYRIFNKPNQFMSRYEMWESTAAFFALYGESFWYLNKAINKNGVAELLVVDPRGMNEIVDPDTKKLVGWKFNNDIPIGLEEIIHFKSLNPYNHYRGLSPLDAIYTDASTDWKASQYQEKFFEHGAVPSGVLQLHPEDRSDIAELRKIKKMWEKEHSGYSKAKKIAVLRGGMEFKPVGLAQQEMDFIASREFTRDMILALFGVPKTVAGFTEGINRASAETHKRLFWQETLKPLMVRIQEKLNSEFFPIYMPGHYGMFDFTKVDELQRSYTEEVDVAYKLFQMGVSKNELNKRFAFGIEDDTEGDMKYVPLNMVPVDVSYYENLTENNESSSKSIEKETKPTVKETVENRMQLHFNRLHAQYEAMLIPKLRGYLFKQRKLILAAMDNKKSENEVEAQTIMMNIDIWDEENKKLIMITSPLFKEIIEGGQNMALQNLGIDRQAEINKYVLTERIQKLTRVNDTIRKRIFDQIKEGISNGETISQLADRIKKVYNRVNTRAVIIARTETTAALNAGALAEYKDAGIQFKKWKTAQDERVREEHSINAAQGPIPIDGVFSNGERFPADGSVNCRCVLLPILREV